MDYGMKRSVILSLSKDVRKGPPAMVRQAHHDPSRKNVMLKFFQHPIIKVGTMLNRLACRRPAVWGAEKISA
jgi:hypothetical protein